tara:strand:+ start:9965 stop:10705 length:741 start_codon:yes stop_codon:yes gene_type:complete
MNPELEKYIDFAVADGEVTDEEKAILVRKAEELGVALDELEMVLGAKLHIRKKENDSLKDIKENTSQISVQQKQNLNPSKCPECQAAIESFSTRCIYCDAEIKNIKSSFSINNLNEKLIEAEEKARNQKSSGGLIGKFMSALDGETEIEKRIYNAKSSVIRTFPIPNTKEDILEFLTLAVASVTTIKINFLERMAGESGTMGHRITYKNAWLNVCQKVIMKARFSMKDDKELLAEIESYANQLEIK